MTKRDDGRKDDYYVTSKHPPEANAQGLTPDTDGTAQVQFDFGPEDRFTVEELDELNFLDKKGVDAENKWRYLRLVRRIKLHDTLGTSTSTRMTRPPGSLLAAISEFVFSKKTLERVVNPIIADMRAEYCEALAAKRPYLARCVRVRYCWSFAKALGLYSILKAAVEMWRKVS